VWVELTSTLTSIYIEYAQHREREREREIEEEKNNTERFRL